MPTTPPVPTGLVLLPFRALRFAPEVPGGQAAVTAPPYDVIDERRRSELAAASPANVVRLILPRPGEPAAEPALATTGEPRGAVPDRYVQAAATLQAWRTRGWLRPDPEPALYVYEITEPGGHRVRGILGAVGLAGPEAGVVLPHENTMAGPVADRLALAEATEADLEPIFLLYDGGGAASDLVDQVADANPGKAAGTSITLILDVTDDAGLRHRLWAQTDPAVHAAVAADLLPRRAVIADGHHRYATYLQHQRACHDAGRGPGPWDYGLALLVDADHGPRVEPVHRVVRGLTAEEAFERAGARLRCRTLVGGPDQWVADLTEAPEHAAGPCFVLADADQALLVAPEPATDLTAAVRRGADAERSAAWAALDVTVAHRWLVPEILGVADTEDNVGYAHDVAEALHAVAEQRAAGGVAVALLMAPTPTAQVLAVAAEGERMPRKSTLFMPKPRSGVVLRAWADQDPVGARSDVPADA